MLRSGFRIIDVRDSRQWPTLASVWNRLMREKKIAARVVYQQIPADRISDEDKKKPEIKEQLEKHGHVEVASELRPDQLAVLESLVELGYAKKRTSKLHKTWVGKEVWLYEPTLKPFGILSLSGPTRRRSASYHLEQAEYERTVEDFKRIKDQMAKGLHPHIEDLSIGVEYEYETQVYEAEDAFFDAVYLQVKDDKLRVWLTLPFFESGDGPDRKNWERLRETEPSKFLEGAKAFLAEVSGLEWKKGAIGALIFDDEGYFMTLGDNAIRVEPSEPMPLLDQLGDDFRAIRMKEDVGALREDFGRVVAEVLRLLGECNESSRQTPKCPISPIFQPTNQAVEIAARLSSELPSTRDELGSLAVDLAKLIWEDSENGKRIDQVVLRDVNQELRVITQLRHHESHDREIGGPGAVRRKYFEVGSIYQAMIGSSVPVSALHWAQLGCCLLVVARQVLSEVLSSIRAIG